MKSGTMRAVLMVGAAMFFAACVDGGGGGGGTPPVAAPLSAYSLIVRWWALGTVQLHPVLLGKQTRRDASSTCRAIP